MTRLIEMENLPTELQEHLALMRWVSTQPIIRDYLIHIPNEGKREVRYGNTLKRMGMRAGVSDLFLPIPRRAKHGLWIELKRQKKPTHSPKLTPEQRVWLELMRGVGYSAEVASGWEEGKDIILDYMS